MKEEINVGLILEYVKDNGLTKKIFCETCGISVTTFDKVVRGEDVKISVLFKIAKGMKVPVNQLLN